MPVTRAFLRPKSVNEPPQGDFEYIPLFQAFEDTTLAGLNAQLDLDIQAQAQSTTSYYVIEEIEYQVVVTQPKTGMVGPELLYSCMIWATEIRKV